MCVWEPGSGGWRLRLWTWQAFGFQEAGAVVSGCGGWRAVGCDRRSAENYAKSREDSFLAI